jgi:hypothetical protein
MGRRIRIPPRFGQRKISGRRSLRCPTCGKSPKRSSPSPTRPGPRYRERRRSRYRMMASVKMWRPPPEWVCETCGKTRYGKHKFAKRTHSQVEEIRWELLKRLEDEEQRTRGAESVLLRGLRTALNEFWGLY